MRSTRPALTALAVAALLSTAACAGQEPSAAPATTLEPRTARQSAPSAAASSSAPAEPDVRTVELEVAGGEVTGDTGRVDVPLGSTFRLVVTSDVIDEVHVHGYDQYLGLTPGAPAEVEIEATIAGVYEVELHDAGTLLTRIAVA